MESDTDRLVGKEKKKSKKSRYTFEPPPGSEQGDDANQSASADSESGPGPSSATTEGGGGDDGVTVTPETVTGYIPPVVDEQQQFAPLVRSGEMRSPVSNASVERGYVPINSDADSSAPSAPSGVPLHGLEDPEKSDELIRKVYAAIAIQHSVFLGSFTLFVFVPHLRKVIRKHLFDPIWLGSSLGFPFIILIALMCLFQSWRRRLAYGLSIVTAICLSLLLSYAIPYGYASAAISHAVTDLLCDAGMVSLTLGGHRRRRVIRPTSWPSLTLLPLTGAFTASAITAGILQAAPTGRQLIGSLVGPLSGSLLMGYTGTSLRGMITARDPQRGLLILQPGDHLYAATAVYYWPLGYFLPKRWSDRLL